MDLSDLDLNLLVAFDALLKERHVTRAGKRIGLSQPAMSSALARLRADFGDELFIRRPGGMQPTPRALELSVPLQSALEQIRGAISGGTPFEPDAAERTFALALAEDAAFVFLPRIAARLREAPHLRLNVQSTSRIRGVELVSRGESDLAIGLVPPPVPPHVRVEALYEDCIVGMARRAHPGLKQRRSLEEFLALRHVRLLPVERRESMVDVALARLGLRRNVVVTLPHFLVAPFLLGESDLVCMEPARIVRPFAQVVGLEVLDPPFDIPPITIAQAWHRRFDNDAGHRWLRDLVRDVAAAA